MIYLDHSATSPIADPVREAMAAAAAEFWGNPSSLHAAGRRARTALQDARASLAACIGASPESMVFTGSGSEAANLAIKGLLAARKGRRSHVVLSAIEHDCVRRALHAMAARHDWITFTEVAPGESGAVSPASMDEAITDETCLVCLMHANNETGVVQPVAEVARIARRRGARLLSDAVQSPGRARLDVGELGCEFLALSAHKFHGPRGIGALYVREGLELEPLIHGGTQEGGRRAGTENLPGAIGMARAAELANADLEATIGHLNRLESAFLEKMASDNFYVEINGSRSDKLAGIVNMAIEGTEQDDLVVGMDLEGIAISAGSACSSGVMERSRVLTSMGLPDWRIRGGIRISFGRENTHDEAERAATALIALCRRLTGRILVEGRA